MTIGWRRVDLWLALAVIALDQAAKAFIRQWLPLHGSVAVIPGLLDLTYVHNTGAAFGFLNAVDFPYKSVAIVLVSTAALVTIAVYAARVSPHQWVARLGLALILGGAGGNLIDRLAAGHVVDFVDLYWHAWHFWAFNVADSAITVGAAALILDMLISRPHPSGAGGAPR